MSCTAPVYLSGHCSADRHGHCGGSYPGVVCACDCHQAPSIPLTPGEPSAVHSCRAITVRQPWAWAIAHGGKLVENRSRGTGYRGTLLIHAGKVWSERGARDDRVIGAVYRVMPWPGDRANTAHLNEVVVPTVRLTGVLAVAQLVDSHPDANCCRPWGESEYPAVSGQRRTAVHHLVLEDVIPLPDPIPARGELGLWRPSQDLAAAAISAALAVPPSPTRRTS